MNAFTKRYFVWIGLIYLAFSYFALAFEGWKFFVAFSIFALIFVVIMRKFKPKIKNMTVLCIFMIMASFVPCVRAQMMIYNNDSLLKEYGGEHYVSGYVSGVAANTNYFSEYVLHVEEIDGVDAEFDLVVVSDFKSDLNRGDFILLRMEISALEESGYLSYMTNGNPYEYPLCAFLSEETEIDYFEGDFRIRLWLSDLNSKLSSRLKAMLNTKVGSLASALLLGNRDLLSDSLIRDFKRAGVYHMLALSGLHVSILVGICGILLKKLRVNPALRIMALGLISFFYIALTGFLPSACRSMLMLWTGYIGFLISKTRDPMTALFFAVGVIIFIEPYAILDIGLWLSFLSTFGIIAASIIQKKLRYFRKEIVGSKAHRRLVKLWRGFLALNLSSLCVFVATLPVLMIFFGEVSLATFITNIFMGAVCECFILLALLTLIFFGNGVIASLISGLAALVGNAMIGIVSFIADVKNVMLSLNYPFIEFLVWGLFVGSLILFAFKLNRKWLIGVPSALFALLLCLDITIFNISLSDSVRVEYLWGDELVLSSNRGVYVCDSSDGTYEGFFTGISQAKENCYTEIDGIILTHYHSDHTITLSRIAHRYKLRSIFLPMPTSSDEGLVMRSIADNLFDEGVRVYVYEPGEVIHVLGGEMVVSERAYFNGKKDVSVACNYTYGESSITFIGRPYFGSYLDESGSFEGYISQSDYIIMGSHGYDPKNDFDIFSLLKKGAEVSFADFKHFEMSNYEGNLDNFIVYFDVSYKKYDFK